MAKSKPSSEWKAVRGTKASLRKPPRLPIHPKFEASKKELQTLNKKLTTSNTQLQTRMEELEGTTNDLSGLLSSANIAVLFLDFSLRVCRFTPAVQDFFDLTTSDIGRPLQELSPKFEDDDLVSHAEEVLQQLLPLEREVRNETGRVYMRRIQPYHADENRMEGVVVTFIDINERKQAEEIFREEQEQYRFILDGIKEYAIMRLDREGRISTWTEGAARIFGYSSKEIIERDMALLFSREECEARIPEKRLETARELGHVSGDGWRVRKDGSRFWATGILSSLHNKRGELCGFVKLIRDNTDHKVAEDAVRQAKNVAEAANESNNQFLSNIAQELEPPLSAILFHADLLEKEGLKDPKRFHDILDVIKRSVEDQKKLIEDLANIARIAAGKLRLEMKPFALATMAHDAIEAVGSAAKAKGVTIEQTINPAIGMVEADPHRMQQIILNLLNLAVKFTPKKGYVHLKVSRRGADVEIKVADTGIGISENLLAAIFEPFAWMDHSNKGTEKLGLALTVTKQLVELHGGTISVYSTGRDQGSTFTVILPLPALDEVPNGSDEPANLQQEAVGKLC